MADDPDFERISRKAHELWEAEGRPHGRDQDHWDQAREIIAIEDSQKSTLLPRDTGREEPEEPSVAVDNLGDVPGLTDQGEHALTDTSREPAVTSPARAANTTGDTAGAVTRPKQGRVASVDDDETVTPAPKPAKVSGQSRAAVPPPAAPKAAEPKADARSAESKPAASARPGASGTKAASTPSAKPMGDPSPKPATASAGKPSAEPSSKSAKAGAAAMPAGVKSVAKGGAASKSK